MREGQILTQLDAGATRIEAMVPVLYRDIDPRLHPAAARSVLAHLQDLAGRGRVRCAGDGWTLA
jgi:hypothetical protein